MFKDLPDRTTPLNASYLNNVLNLILPINKVEVFFDAEDHSNYMGFTWERISQGRVPVGLDTSDEDFNVIGKTAGEKKHQLTVGELPSHTHGIYKTIQGLNGTNSGRYDAILYGNNMSQGQCNSLSTGSNQSHNNLQPYIVMAFWKRVA